MKYYCSVLFVLVITNLLFSQNDSIRIYTYIKLLGTQSYESKVLHNSLNDFNILDSLYNYPSISIEFLIKELKPIKNVVKITLEEYDNYKYQTHIIWCIRALKYMTGLDFSANTKHIFTKNESEREYFLHSTSESEVNFFGVRMSHDTIFIAPFDAQIKIIQKWKSWYKKNKCNIKLEKVKELNEWYFG